MNVSKNQVIMLSIGGVALVASLALGYLTYDAWATKSELSEEVESESSSVRSLLRADVSPDKASVVDIGKNRAKVTGWCEAALSVAASGDRMFPTNITPTAVKEKIVKDARELSELPGDVNGRIVKSDFGFGFSDFVTGNKIPERTNLGKIQRQWYDVSLLVRTLSDCGVVEVMDVKAEPPPKVQEGEPKADKRNNRNSKKGAEEKPVYTSERYELEFRADGPALAKAVNAIATSERFFVIDSLDFYRKEDPLASALGGDDKKKEGAQSAKPVRRRLRRSESDEESAAKEKEEEKKNGPICGPGAMPPFIVKAVVVSYDFGTAAQKAEAERAESAPADADKDSAKDKKEDSK